MGLLNFLLPTDPARDYEEDPGGTVAALAKFERRTGRIATSRDRLVRDGDEYVKAPLL
jgi:hypothetical protein